MEKYEQLKKVIHKANPDIAGLQVGSEVKMRARPYTEIVTKIDVMEHWHGEVMVSTDRAVGQTNADLYEVISGRPIRLADVLLSFPGAIYPLQLLALGHPASWNLSDDNLDHQSEETKQLLIDLLVK